MYSLHQALLEHHLIVLRVLGEWYELDLVGQDNEGCARALAAALLEVDFEEDLLYLQPDEVDALRALVSENGQLPVATFGRSYGEVRQMGPGKLDREQPWLNPATPAEALWYRGFLYRGFDETDDGLVEYYYIPEELLAKITPILVVTEPPPPPKFVPKTPPKPISQEEHDADLAAALADVEAFIQKTRAARAESVPDPLPEVSENVQEIAPSPEPPAPVKIAEPTVALESRPAPAVTPSTPVSQPARPEPSPSTPIPMPMPTAPVEPDAPPEPPTDFQPATTLAVDDLTTILALAQRDPISLSETSQLVPFLRDGHAQRLAFLIQVGLDAGLMRVVDNALRPARIAADWLQATREQQLRALFDSWRESVWNELRHVEQIVCEGDWQNNPQAARQALLAALPRDDGWFSAETLIHAIHQSNPDFQRPDGDYDSWYIRDAASGDFLRGFDCWQQVEGRLLRALLAGPMVWLGLLDVSDDAVTLKARLSARALAFLADRTPQAHEVNLPIVLESDASMSVPLQASRYQRFQASRIAEPQPVHGNQPYRLRITPASLALAKEQGIKPERVLQFLGKAGGNRPIPAGTRRAIERWSQNGVEGRLEPVVVLRVGDPAVIDTLRKNPKTRDLLGESLGEMAVVVRREHARSLQNITAQLGLLLDFIGE